MTEIQPYTGHEIERMTEGYVNSGLLRMWVSQGRLVAGPRAQTRGRPRTFDYKQAIKATLMAELRQHGVSMDNAEKWADHFLDATLQIDKEAQTKGKRAYLSTPFYIAIQPRTLTVIPISLNEATKSFAELMRRLGPSVTIIDVVRLFERAMKAISGKSDDGEAAPKTKTHRSA